MRGASATRLAMIWTALDPSLYGSDILCIRVVAYVINGLRVQCSAPGFLVDGQSFESASRAPDDLERYLVGTAVRWQFNARYYVQGFACAFRADERHWNYLPSSYRLDIGGPLATEAVLILLATREQALIRYLISCSPCMVERAPRPCMT